MKQYLLGALSACLFLLRCASAQVAGGSISGTVVDPAGAAVAGAQVTVEDKTTGTSRQITTSRAGLYSAPNLTPGTYQVKVSAPGFSTTLRTDLAVSVGSELLVNLQLQLGATTSTIEVHESAPA